MNVNQAADLFSKLTRLDEKVSGAISEFSHASARTDHTRIACEQVRFASAHQKESVIKKAQVEELEALDNMMEVITKNPDDEARAKLVAKLKSENIKLGNTVGSSRRIRDSIYSYQAYVGLKARCVKEGKEFPKCWSDPFERLEKEMRDLGLEI